MAKRKASAGTATTTARSKKAKTSNTNNDRDSEPDRLVVDHRHESSSPNLQVPVDNIHYDNGPYPRQEYNHHNLHSLDIDPRLDIMNHHFHMGNDGTGSGGSMDAAMMGNTDEGDNRSRNAKAQRRHREKRKAHLKALEDSVQLLTAQLEDARRQLGQAAYITGNRPGGPAGSAPLSPQQTKDNNQAQAENAYLRDENADLRRQLYAYRVSYPPPPPSVGKDGNGDWNEVKPEAFMYAPGGSPGRRSGGPRGSNEVGPVNSGESGTSTADGSSGPNSANASNQNSNGYPVDHFANMHQRSRSRVPSASSAPSASPYMPSDPRSMDARYAPPPNVRYEPQSGMYNAPPPHAVPRYDPSAGPDGHQQHSGHYGRPDGHNGVSWPPESGPPPFTAYGMGFPHDSQGQQQQSQDWRQEH